MGGSRGGGDRGSGTPLKNHRNIGFLCNTGLYPLKITKLPSQNSMVAHHRHASETPLKWRFAGGPMMAQLKRYLDPLSPNQLKKNVIKFGPPLTKLSGFAHVYFAIFVYTRQKHLIQVPAKYKRFTVCLGLLNILSNLSKSNKPTLFYNAITFTPITYS